MAIKSIKSKQISYFVFILLILLFFFLPLIPIYPTYGYDAGWVYFLSYAFLRALESGTTQFGKDVIFTYGPYGVFNFPSIYVGSKNLIYGHFAVFGILSLIISSSLSKIFVKNSVSMSLLSIFGLWVALLYGGIFYLIFPLLMIGELALGILPIPIILSFSLALASLVKSSYIPIVGIVCICVDTFQLRKKSSRLPFASILTSVFFLVLWLLARQDLKNLFSFFRGTFEIAKGFNEAMSLPGDYLEIIYFLLVWILYVSAILSFYFLRKGRTYENKLNYLLCFIPFVLISFIGFKLGFVRHDSHAGSGFATLLMLSSVLILLVPKDGLFPKVLKLVLCICMLISTVFIYNNATWQKGITFKTFLSLELYNVRARIDAIGMILRGDFFKELDRRYQYAISEIRNKIALPEVVGSVDIFPWDVSSLIANEFNYRPRPIFQSYSVYTPYLLEKNRSHFSDNNAPDNIFFAIGEIDGKFPAGMEGKSWPQLLTSYCPVKFIDIFLWMEKCKLPRKVEYSQLMDENRLYGQEVVVPSSGGNIWAELKIEKTILGSLLSILYRLPIISMKVVLADGIEREFRIVPENVGEGFVLSPLIENAHELVALDVPWVPLGKRVRSISLSAKSSIARLFYGNSYQIKLSKFSFDRRYNWDVIPSAGIMHYMFALNNGRHSNEVRLYQGREVLFSHMTSRTALPTFGARSVSGAFGVFDEAFKDGKIEGACFHVYEGTELNDKERTSSRKLLWSRCLDPLNRKGDQGEQSFSIDLKSSKASYLELEILPPEGKSEEWGWTYWSDVKLMP